MFCIKYSTRCIAQVEAQQGIAQGNKIGKICLLEFVRTTVNPWNTCFSLKRFSCGNEFSDSLPSSVSVCLDLLVASVQRLRRVSRNRKSCIAVVPTSCLVIIVSVSLARPERICMETSPVCSIGSFRQRRRDKEAKRTSRKFVIHAYFMSRLWYSILIICQCRIFLPGFYITIPSCVCYATVTQTIPYLCRLTLSYQYHFNGVPAPRRDVILRRRFHRFDISAEISGTVILSFPRGARFIIIAKVGLRSVFMLTWYILSK